MAIVCSNGHFVWRPRYGAHTDAHEGTAPVRRLSTSRDGGLPGSSHL
jgi:hypothetical protein